MSSSYKGQRVRVTFDGLFLKETDHYRAIQVGGDSVLMIPKHLTSHIGPTPWVVRRGDVYRRNSNVYQIMEELDRNGYPTGGLEAWETGSSTPVPLETLGLLESELIHRED